MIASDPCNIKVFIYFFNKDFADEIDDAGILSPICSEYRKDCGINIHLPANISIDLPALNWTFQLDLLDLDCIGNDTELACVYQDQISTESYNQQSISMLRYCLQHGEPIMNWFILPTEDANKIYLCTYNFIIALSPVITFTVEILCNHEWVLHIPFGALNWRNHPLFKELPVDVKAGTNAIDDAKQCEGISDKRFDILVTKHKGKFFDFSS